MNCNSNYMYIVYTQESHPEIKSKIIVIRMRVHFDRVIWCAHKQMCVSISFSGFYCVCMCVCCSRIHKLKPNSMGFYDKTVALGSITVENICFIPVDLCCPTHSIAWMCLCLLLYILIKSSSAIECFHFRFRNPLTRKKMLIRSTIVGEKIETETETNMTLVSLTCCQCVNGFWNWERNKYICTLFASIETRIS